MAAGVIRRQAAVEGWGLTDFLLNGFILEINILASGQRCVMAAPGISRVEVSGKGRWENHLCTPELSRPGTSKGR